MPSRLSIIVPFHRDLPSLRRCLAALASRPAGSELIVAADGAVDDCHEVAAASSARVLDLHGPAGPAAARNAAVRAAAGDVIVFVDADVVVARGTLDRIVRAFDSDPDLSAIFGAYDEEPSDSGFFSQYKNLAHSYIHRTSASAAKTFWAGFGAVRREVFTHAGGFDERFRRPSVEDIELGYRLTASGYKVVLDPSLRASHLKRWTFASMVVSDVRDRGIPWTQLLLRYGALDDDLNVRWIYRLCVLLAYAAMAGVALALAVDARFVWMSLTALAGLALLGWPYYRYFHQRRGAWFAWRVFPVHVLHHLYNGLSFALGTSLFVANRLGIRFSAALPPDEWTRQSCYSGIHRSPQ